MPAILWILIGFISGSIPFSLLLGKAALKRDIRNFGDGNPGATNVFRAGGRWVGAAAILLDAFKATIPIAAAYFWGGLSPTAMVAMALAPLIGHAFSPFLQFRGGKAVAAMFGMWAGLTLGEMPIIIGLFMALFVKLVRPDGWSVMLSLAGGLAYLLLHHPDPFLLAVWAGSTVILAYTHRADLAQRPHLRLVFRLHKVKTD